MHKTGWIFRALLASAFLLTAAQAASARCLRMRIIASGKPVHFLDKEAHKAENNAISAWEYLAARQAGKAFAKWKNARGGKIECWLPNRSNTQCKAIATPCDGK